MFGMAAGWEGVLNQALHLVDHLEGGVPVDVDGGADVAVPEVFGQGCDIVGFRHDAACEEMAELVWTNTREASSGRDLGDGACHRVRSGEHHRMLAEDVRPIDLVRSDES